MTRAAIDRPIASILAALLASALALAQEPPPEQPPRRAMIAAEPIADPLPSARLVGALSPALAAAGRESSPDALMTLLGYAFSFSMNPRGGETWHWSGIEWGYFFDMLAHLGADLEIISGSLNGARKMPPDAFRGLKERAWERVRASIDRGVPAVAWQPMTTEQWKGPRRAWAWGLIVGYDLDAKTYTVRHRDVGEYTVPWDGFGHTDGVNWWCVIVVGAAEKGEAATRRARALREALAFAKGERNAADSAAAGGFAAYEMWAAAFRTRKVDREHAPRHAEHLQRARTSAARYLRSVAADFPRAGPFLEAAALYEKEAATAGKLLDLCRAAREKGFTEASSAEAAALLESCLEDDRAATAKLEAALAGVLDAKK